MIFVRKLQEILIPTPSTHAPLRQEFGAQNGRSIAHAQFVQVVIVPTPSTQTPLLYWSSYASCRISGVNVFEFFSSRDSVSEAETAVAIGQVVCALCYLHQAKLLIWT